MFPLGVPELLSAIKLYLARYANKVYPKHFLSKHSGKHQLPNFSGKISLKRQTKSTFLYLLKWRSYSSFSLGRTIKTKIIRYKLAHTAFLNNSEFWKYSASSRGVKKIAKRAASHQTTCLIL